MSVLCSEVRNEVSFKTTQNTNQKEKKKKRRRKKERKKYNLLYVIFRFCTTTHQGLQACKAMTSGIKRKIGFFLKRK